MWFLRQDIKGLLQLTEVVHWAILNTVS